MVRGYQKKVVFLKNPKSRIFEEAYFILREDSPPSRVNKGDMIEEANRIIEENSELCEGRGAHGKRGLRRLRLLISFLLGAVIGALVIFFIK